MKGFLFAFKISNRLRSAHVGEKLIISSAVKFDKLNIRLIKKVLFELDCMFVIGGHKINFIMICHGNFHCKIRLNYLLMEKSIGIPFIYWINTAYFNPHSINSLTKHDNIC